MKCVACDRILTDHEATRRYASSGDFVDLCDHCLNLDDDFPDVIEREDLKTYENIENEEE